MKKIFLTAIVLALSFTGVSCEDDDDNSSVHIPSSELPAPAAAFLDTYFNDIDIVKVEKDVNSNDEYYEVDLAGGIEVHFDQAGNWTEVDGNGQPIPTGFIPDAIVTHVSENYQSQAIESIDKKSYGYAVDLLNGTELRYDQSGEFIGTGN
jgi:hypothetical protein